jgi:hypothetical protein
LGCGVAGGPASDRREAETLHMVVLEFVNVATPVASGAVHCCCRRVLRWTWVPQVC